MLLQPCAGALFQFEETGSLAIARVWYTATLLQNGKVLVVGGYSKFGWNTSSAELYDPASGTWSTTGSLATGRALHTATLLQDGKVLVAGGVSGFGGTYLKSAELYDPATGTWTTTGKAFALHSLITRQHCCLTARCSSPVDPGEDPRNPPTRNSTIRPPGFGQTAEALSRHAINTQQHCYLTARYSSRAVLPTTIKPPARNSSIPLAGRGQRPAASSAHALSTPQHCCPMVRSLSQAVKTLRLLRLLRAPNSTIRRAELGPTLVASLRHAGATRLRCCPAAKCWSQAVQAVSLVVRSGARNFMMRQAALGRTLPTSSTHATVTPRRYYARVIRCSSQVVGGLTAPFSRAQNSAIGSAYCRTRASQGRIASSKYPIVQLRSLDSNQVVFLLPDPVGNWSDTSFISRPVRNFPFGPTAFRARRSTWWSEKRHN
jgi:hypothetical protein